MSLGNCVVGSSIKIEWIGGGLTLIDRVVDATVSHLLPEADGVLLCSLEEAAVEVEGVEVSRNASVVLSAVSWGLHLAGALDLADLNLPGSAGSSGAGSHGDGGSGG